MTFPPFKASPRNAPATLLKNLRRCWSASLRHPRTPATWCWTFSVAAVRQRQLRRSRDGGGSRATRASISCGVSDLVVTVAAPCAGQAVTAIYHGGARKGACWRSLNALITDEGITAKCEPAWSSSIEKGRAGQPAHSLARHASGLMRVEELFVAADRRLRGFTRNHGEGAATAAMAGGLLLRRAVGHGHDVAGAVVGIPRLRERGGGEAGDGDEHEGCLPDHFTSPGLRQSRAPCSCRRASR